MKILHLSLKKEPFEVMVTGEKNSEYRKRSAWMLSRLVDKKNNSLKEYTHVKFVNGYGNDKPYFIAEYKGFEYCKIPYTIGWSNLFEVTVEQGDVIINLGKIIEKGNLK